MARDISTRAMQTLRTGPRFSTRCAINIPGTDDPVYVALSDDSPWSVQGSAPVAGTRLTATSVHFLPWVQGQTSGIPDLFSLLGYPGATFDISVGINLGTSIEYIPIFHGYAVDGSLRRNSLGATASLTDPWNYFDRIPFTEPLHTTTDTRAHLISEIFTSLALGVSAVVAGDGGTVSQDGVYTGSRGQAALQLATDGKLQAGWDAAGDLIIKDQPPLDGDLAPLWQFRAGDITPTLDTVALPIVGDSLQRTRAWADSLINAVAVVPGDESQVWASQVAKLADTSDPRHESKVGLRGIEVTSNTIDNACDALLLAQQELTRRLRFTAERIGFTTVLNPAMEQDDPIYVAAPKLFDDPGWNSNYIITGLTHTPSAGTTAVEAVSLGAYILGQ